AGASPTPRLYVVTRRAQCVNGEDVCGLAHAPVVGLARTTLAEHPELRCTVVDVDSSVTRETAAELARELLCDSPDTEAALRSTGRYVFRLARFSMEHPRAEGNVEATLTATQAGRFRLQIGKPGRLETLRFHQIPSEPPPAGEVEIRVRAA